MGSDKKYISGECDLCSAYFTERSKMLDSGGICKECLSRFISHDDAGSQDDVGHNA